MKNKKDFTKFFHNILIKSSPKIASLIFLISVVGYYFGSQVQLKLSLTDLLPDNHPAVVKFNKLTEVVGGVGYFTIVLNADDGKSHLKVAQHITEELSKSDLVRSAFYHREQRFFADRLLYYLNMDQIKELEVNIAEQIRVTKAKMFDIGLSDENPKETKAAFDGELKAQAKKTSSISPFLISNDLNHLLIMVKPNFDSTDLGKTESLIEF